MVMAERRKNKKKKEAESRELEKKPSKEEYDVAQYLKKMLPEKKTTLHGHKVEYFIASRAIDCLVESHWANENKKGKMNFSNRDTVVAFMETLLTHKFFHRAKKIVVQKESKKKKKVEPEKKKEIEPEKKKEIEPEKKKEIEPEKKKEIEPEKKKEIEPEKEKEIEPDKKKEIEFENKKEIEADKKNNYVDNGQEFGKKEESKKEGKEIVKKSKEELASSPEMGKKKKNDAVHESGKDSKKKKCTEIEKTKDKDGKKDGADVKKKKIKLDMHMEQIFIDSNEPYVWIYDPIPLKTWVTGTLMVIAAVLLCLFPLWPQTIRHYIYYLSVAAAFFLVFIIGLAVLRIVVFVIVWVVTFGRHHLWLLPNLTEDVGFFESFWPLYNYEYKGTVKKEKCSDDEDDKSKNEEPSEEDKPRTGEEPPEDQEESNEDEQKSDDQDSEDLDPPGTENGFEFLEADEIEEDRKTK